MDSDLLGLELEFESLGDSSPLSDELFNNDIPTVQELLAGPKRVKRKYTFTPEGLAKRLASIAKTRPERFSRGAKTWQGKCITRLNALKHGLTSQLVPREERRRFKQLMENLRRQDRRLGGRPADPKTQAIRNVYALRLGYARAEAQLSKSALARRAGLCLGTIDLAERAQSTPTPQTQAKIASALAAMGVNI
jgi:DNA-binding XRE family transcriptional regulator